MDRPELYHTVKTTEVRENRAGTGRAQFKAGTRVDLGTAYEYGLVDEPAVVGARPADEKPDVAENDEPTFSVEDQEVRANQSAPETKARKAAPENKGA